ncbi:hypothetical protein D3C86_2266670 [compost metagenome]
MLFPFVAVMVEVLASHVTRAPNVSNILRKGTSVLPLIIVGCWSNESNVPSRRTDINVG